jgi:RNA polymerase sigma factor for flagellar operon FliA
MSTVPLSPADFDLLCDVIASVARTSGLPAPDAEDFAQHVHLHLMERRYAALTAFAGRSSLRTFLTVVVRRILLDWRNQRFGKWRPSSQAKRLGPVAVALDRLMSRDGHRSEEAVAMLKGRPACTHSQPLRELAARLPRRRRAQVVVPDTFEGLAAAAFEDPVQARQASEARREALRRLRAACGRLPDADRQLLVLRFRQGLSIRDIAARLGQPDKPLYRRMERIVASLRRAMAAADGPAPGGGAAADGPSSAWLTH